MGIRRVCNLIFQFRLWVHSFIECRDTLLMFLFVCVKDLCKSF